MTRLFLLFCSVVLFTAAANAEGRKEYIYGPERRQVLDVYGDGQGADFPVLVMLHGGAWKFGDKQHFGTWRAKVAHWVPRGYVFVSVNTRLLPDADPVQQAVDLSLAMAFVQRKARSWGGDPGRIVLMGHSAGAHVAALLTTRQGISSRTGTKPWIGTIILDTVMLNVPRIMQQNPSRMHRNAFGNDPKFWKTSSPTEYLGSGDRPMIVVCSSKRKLSCPEARRFARHAARVGAQVTVLPVNLRHGKINSDLGMDSAYTASVDKWLAGLGLP
ncbi:MAG: alpha/beta hydrolase [Rhodobacteraceae bacterium]|nr:alpha/beta hydrolase [Paracoccaceae bacterium]